MNIQRIKSVCWMTFFSLAFMFNMSGKAWATIDGVTGNTFNFTAKTGLITTPDGDSLMLWGYALGDGPMQYPGPTLIVNQGDTITINLNNDLGVTDMPVSIVFPGQQGVGASGGSAGLLTQESTGPADMVSYTFTASHAGTYQYYSGTRPDLQLEMGLLGAIIVRPSVANQAYNHPETAYDQEYLFLLTEMDPEVHYRASLGQFDIIDNTEHNPVLWFINGRNAPDTLADPGVSWLPHQPYNILPRTHPGDTVLARVISAGRDLHPFHFHGNHVRIIAQDGRLLQSAPGNGTDLSRVDFTIQAVPGETYDALWNWTGDKLGWDIYGHASGDPLEPSEYAADHGKPIPVTLPELQDMSFGGFWGGSPFLGAFADLPPGEGGLNLNGGMFYMWHSHAEKELANNDVFPGGMMTMMIVEPPAVTIP
jgi:FtsP/CotA-like multicopper oxidase with cupredoxin domain